MVRLSSSARFQSSLTPRVRALCSKACAPANMRAEAFPIFPALLNAVRRGVKVTRLPSKACSAPNSRRSTKKNKSGSARTQQVAAPSVAGSKRSKRQPA